MTAARILLADDSAAVLAAVGQALRNEGHLVTSTNNGADALCLLAAKPPPELLILDLNMPGLDGHKVISALGPSSPPVLVITGEDLTEHDFATGKVKRVLLKPFDLKGLLAAVADVLGRVPAA
jgi:DNA-binding response OmpR family regulator